MKTKLLNKLAVMLLAASAISSGAQTFSSGSDGSYGPLIVRSNTVIDLPPDGVLHCTVIDIVHPSGQQISLSFRRNPLNTPVYLLAQSNVLIGSGAYISVTGDNRLGSTPGRGGPGGFDGGFGSFQGFGNGDGQGPGAGRYSFGTLGGVYANPTPNNTNIYGNTLINPLIGGSGGAGGTAGGADSRRGGGGGGGAILIASSTRITLNGSIDAYGGVGFGGGSGGAIRLVAPVINGNGNVRPVGNVSDFTPGHNGTDGRSRIDSLDRFSHRDLILSGKATRGTQMFVFPPGPRPKLDIIHAAGRDIPEGTNAPVSVTLPVGASTNQLVRVKATNFTNDVPVTLAITPENAPSARFHGVITNTGPGSVGEFTVTLPVDTVTYLHVWTR